MTSRLLHNYLHEAVARWPDAVAIREGDRTVTFAALASLASVIATRLRAAGLEPGDRVALFAPKSIETIAAMLGTLEVGGVYVPVDVDSPAPRVAHVLRAAAPRVVLVAAPAVRLLDAVRAELPGAAPQIGALQDAPLAGNSFTADFALGEVDPAEAAAESVSSAAGGLAAAAPAHLLFTSGSTGVPKGVVITHANVRAFIDWAVGYFGFRAGERISGHPPLHFDLSTFDIYAALASGAELHLVPKQVNLTAKAVRDFIASRELTQWFSVPSALNLLAKFDAVSLGDFPRLERLLWCGEALPTPTLIYLMERLPHVRFTNLYGPTEATIASSYHTLAGVPASPQAEIPIGVPCAGERLLVLDEAGGECAPGARGELYIAGAGLSPGYWQDKEKTAAAFREWTDPQGQSLRIYRTGDLARLGDDGLYYFHGRADSQIKSRGYRIELGEVEAALHTLPGLRESAIVAIDSEGFDGKMICGAYVLAEGSTADAAELRRALARLLPAYMLPVRWQALPALPRNANGKVDRPALRALFEAHDATA